MLIASLAALCNNTFWNFGIFKTHRRKRNMGQFWLWERMWLLSHSCIFAFKTLRWPIHLIFLWLIRLMWKKCNCYHFIVQYYYFLFFKSFEIIEFDQWFVYHKNKFIDSMQLYKWSLWVSHNRKLIWNLEKYGSERVKVLCI